MHLKEAAEELMHFQFMATDAVPIHGLQDWPLSLWENAFKKLPQESMMFASAFLDEDTQDRWLGRRGWQGSAGKSGK